MRSRPSRDMLACLALVLATLISAVQSGLANSAAGTSPEYQVKAVFLFNFAQFVEWAAAEFRGSRRALRHRRTGNGSFRIGTGRRGPRRDTSTGGSIVIERYRSVTEIRRCQILFISRSEAAHIGGDQRGVGRAQHSDRKRHRGPGAARRDDPLCRRKTTASGSGSMRTRRRPPVFRSARSFCDRQNS